MFKCVKTLGTSSPISPAPKNVRTVASFLDKILIISSLFTSIIVIANFVIFNVRRSYNYSCISGAQVSLILGSITLFILLGKENFKSKLFLFFIYILSITSVFLSETRGVIICVLFSVIVVLFLRFKSVKLRHLVACICAFLAITYTFVMSVPSLNARYSNSLENLKVLDQSIKSEEFDGNSSISIRYNFIKHGFLAFLENPTFGSGRKGFRQEMVEQGYDEKYLKNLTHTHNQFISDLVMRGLFGFLSTIFFMLILILIFFALRKNGEKQFSSYGIILITCYTMFFFTDSPFIGSMHATLFFIFCCLLFFNASLHNVPISNET